MAIDVESIIIKNQENDMEASSYIKAVGDYDGVRVNDRWDYANKVGIRTKEPIMQNMYEEGTVNGKFVLSGKAGITPNFYQAFSDSFEQYKQVIKQDLDEMNTNPNIKRAFRGEELETAVNNLLKAVAQEAEDYLLKLEMREKDVINQVKEAFRKQQQSVSSDMNEDTKKIVDGDTLEGERKKFDSQAQSWYENQTPTTPAASGGGTSSNGFVGGTGVSSVSNTAVY